MKQKRFSKKEKTDGTGYMHDEGHLQLKEGERIDDLLSPSFKIIQHDRYFRFSLDAVLLANFTMVKKGELVVDLGTGTGAIPLLLAGRQQPGRILGLEIQNVLADMARRNVLLNGLTDRVDIRRMDLKEAGERLGCGIADVVTANPPYRPVAQGKLSGEEPMAIARHEICCTLQDVIATAGQLLKNRGRFYMVHLAERLGDIICVARRHRLEPKKLRMVHAFVQEGAKLVLIQMTKGAQVSLEVLSPLVIYEGPGKYTPEVFNYYYPEAKVFNDGKGRG